MKFSETPYWVTTESLPRLDGFQRYQAKLWSLNLP
jgi:hypothetical protein